MLLVLGWSFTPVSSDQLSPTVRYWSDIAHSPVYAVLTGLTLMVFRSRLGFWTALPAAGIFMAAVGAAVEWLQPLVGRARDVSDVLMNLLGIAVAVGVAVFIQGLRRVNGRVSTSCERD